MDDLFAEGNTSYQPLAAQLRPSGLDRFFGQEHILGNDTPLRKAIEAGTLHSMILWGPPGAGKTTLARILSTATNSEFLTLSAVTSGVKDIRNAVLQAQQVRAQSGRGTILFVDEVHRFNKAQQDGFLPYIEDGTFMFVGATTENPSFELNNALLSRCKVYVLKPLDEPALDQILDVALKEIAALQLDSSQRQRLRAAADGDARRLLNLVEIAADLADTEGKIAENDLNRLLADGTRRFDKGGDEFYDQISALHKSVRGSDPDAALYWFARMLEGGCDPLYVARRVQRMASEDIGNADPRALEVCLNGWQTYDRLGSPEGELAIAQAIVYLACAPKSNAVYRAYNEAMRDVKADPSYPVPMHLRNAPTSLLKDLGRGKGYRYAHDEAGRYAAGETYLPDEISERKYYYPSDQGLEIKIKQKLDYFAQLDARAAGGAVRGDLEKMASSKTEPQAVESEASRSSQQTTAKSS